MKSIRCSRVNDSGRREGGDYKTARVAVKPARCATPKFSTLVIPSEVEGPRGDIVGVAKGSLHSASLQVEMTDVRSPP